MLEEALRTKNVGPECEGCDGAVYQEVEILDDLSHLPEWKRPPKKVWKVIKEAYRLEQDTSPDRPVLEQQYPGLPIKDLAGIHSGKCAIFFNGESLKDWPLDLIKYPTIGMNRTYVGWAGYKGPNPDYYCFIDQPWVVKAIPKLPPTTKILDCSVGGKSVGYRIRKSYRMKPFSLDVWRDGACPVTTGFMAIQIAAYMGFTEIYCLGMDLNMKPHFDGTQSGQGMVGQAKAIEDSKPILKREGINLYLCAPSECNLPIRPFSELTHGA